MKLKQGLSFILASTLILGLIGCSKKEETTENTVAPTSEQTTTADNESAGTGGANSKTLVVYFSRVGNTDFSASVDVVASASLIKDGNDLKGNTQLMAEWVAQEEGCETYEILTVNKYPENYRATTDQAKKEQNENARPALLNHIENFGEYEKIYLIFPNWWGDLPQPLYTFFDEYDFSGKQINVFVTHGGSGFSGTISTIKKMEPGATVKEGVSLRDSKVTSSEQEIKSWVKGNQ